MNPTLFFKKIFPKNIPSVLLWWNSIVSLFFLLSVVLLALTVRFYMHSSEEVLLEQSSPVQKIDTDALLNVVKTLNERRAEAR